MRNLARLALAAAIVVALGACRVGEVNRAAVVRFVATAILNGVAGDPVIAAPAATKPESEAAKPAPRCTHEQHDIAAAFARASVAESATLFAPDCPKKRVRRA